jgi:ligand-binding sensor domain-containing protein
MTSGKFEMMTLNAIIFFSVLVLFFSCSGKDTSAVAGSTLGNQNSCPAVTEAIGETVSTIDTSIWYVFQDRNNNYWFGSNGQGVYRYDGKNILHFSTKDGLCNDQLRGIQEDSSGNLYFNTVNGISKYDGKAFTTLRVTQSASPDGGWRLRPGDLWFQGAQDSGVVYRYDGTTLHRLEMPKTRIGEEFIANHPRSKYPNIHFSPYDVYSIYKDRRGNLWFGTNIGVCRYDGRSFAWITEEELGIDDIAYHVRSTFEDKKGNFWFSNTMYVLDVYQDDKARIRKDVTAGPEGSVSFRKEKGIVDSKDHDAAYFMSSVQDSNGDLWMVTYNKGLWRYDGKKLTLYLIKDGAKDVLLFSIYKDKQGGLWLGTHTAGVYKYNGKTFEKFIF